MPFGRLSASPSPRSDTLDFPVRVDGVHAVWHCLVCRSYALTGSYPHLYCSHNPGTPSQPHHLSGLSTVDRCFPANHPHIPALDHTRHRHLTRHWWAAADAVGRAASQRRLKRPSVWDHYQSRGTILAGQPARVTEEVGKTRHRPRTHDQTLCSGYLS